MLTRPGLEWPALASERPIAAILLAVALNLPGKRAEAN
jgi:hypothetical protein